MVMVQPEAWAVLQADALYYRDAVSDASGERAPPWSRPLAACARGGACDACECVMLLQRLRRRDCPVRQ